MVQVCVLFPDFRGVYLDTRNTWRHLLSTRPLSSHYLSDITTHTLAGGNPSYWAVNPHTLVITRLVPDQKSQSWPPALTLLTSTLLLSVQLSSFPLGDEGSSIKPDKCSLKRSCQVSVTSYLLVQLGVLLQSLHGHDVGFQLTNLPRHPSQRSRYLYTIVTESLTKRRHEDRKEMIDRKKVHCVSL